VYQSALLVAEYFGVSIRTIREWMEKDGNFPRPFKKFGTLRFRRSEIEEYWQKNTKH
jgi:predicted DNA-binding transcriptional regulator AlpA